MLTSSHERAIRSRLRRYRAVGVEEQDYLLARAAAHRVMAERSNEAGLRLIHARLEELYRERATKLGLVGQD